jgi:Glycosyltransferase family 87
MKAISFLAARPVIMFVLYCLIAITLGLQTFFVVKTQGERKCKSDGNYQLFKATYHRLLTHEPLYENNYEGQCYGYKYSPTFALAWVAFAYLPDLLGLVLWALMAMLLVHLAIMTFPGLTANQRLGFCLMVLMELILTTQVQQTNAMVVAFLILGFMNLERGSYFWATLLIVASAYIKLFGLGMVVLFLFYPQKPRLVLYTLFWTVVLGLLPLVVVGPAELQEIYGAWFARTAGDYTLYVTMSAYAFLEAVVGSPMPKQLILLLSLGIMIAAFAQYHKWQNLGFRQLALGVLLIWMVAFNHKAESPTYFIAAMGVALWFYALPFAWWRTALLVFGLVTISLMYSDIIPKVIRAAYSYPYALKALGSTVIWLTGIVELVLMQRDAKPLGLRAAIVGIAHAAPVARYTLKRLP